MLQQTSFLFARQGLAMSVPASSPSTSASCSRTQQSSATSPEETTKKSRKKQRRLDEWKSTQRKTKRNRGESYISKTGKEVRGSIIKCIMTL